MLKVIAEDVIEVTAYIVDFFVIVNEIISVVKPFQFIILLLYWISAMTSLLAGDT